MPDDKDSRAPYIIICNGRIALQTSRVTGERIRAASQTATDLVTYYRDKLTDSDTGPISTLQHAMMDAMASGQARHSEEMVDEMFVLLDQLEGRMKSKQDSPSGE